VAADVSIGKLFIAGIRPRADAGRAVHELHDFWSLRNPAPSRRRTPR